MLAMPSSPAPNHIRNVCFQQSSHSLKPLEKIDGERIWAAYAKKFASIRRELKSVDRTSRANRKSIRGNGIDLLKNIYLPRQQAHAGIRLLCYDAKSPQPHLDIYYTKQRVKFNCEIVPKQAVNSV